MSFNPNRWLGHLALLNALALAAPTAFSEETTQRGFTHDEAPEQKGWEEKLRAVPQSENLREYMRVSSQEPHHAGGPGRKKVAEFILSQYESWGLDAWIEEHEAFMPMPTERLLAHEEGLPHREWFRHQICAPGFYTGYGVKTMPGIREGVEENAWDGVERYLSIVTNSIENLAGRVDQARELLVKLLG